MTHSFVLTRKLRQSNTTGCTEKKLAGRVPWARPRLLNSGVCMFVDNGQVAVTFGTGNNSEGFPADTQGNSVLEKTFDNLVAIEKRKAAEWANAMANCDTDDPSAISKVSRTGVEYRTTLSMAYSAANKANDVNDFLCRMVKDSRI